MITKEEYDDFLKLREETFAGIKHSLELDGHCKHYEGTFKLTFPNYFESESPTYSIELFCYVLGPDRHYSWDAKTFSEAIVLARADIKKWVMNLGDAA